MSSYERFTERSRRVCQLANQEAQRLNHEYVSVGHMFLALLKEGSGVAANVLKNLGIDNLDKLRRTWELIEPSGPEMVTMGKLPQTPRVKVAIERALDEADKLQHNYIGTEHLLLGLLADPESAVVHLLAAMNVAPDALRAETMRFVNPPAPSQTMRVRLKMRNGEVLEYDDWKSGDLFWMPANLRVLHPIEALEVLSQ
jgi:ATP-dependent Clp protease ATP-binding subunit ClpC